MSCRLCHFCTVKRWKNIGEITYIGDLCKITLALFPRLQYLKKSQSISSATNSFLIVPLIEFCKKHTIFEDTKNFLNFYFISLLSSNILGPIWNYISENKSEQEWRPSNRLFTKVENYIGAWAINQWRHLHREWGTSVQPLKKLTANGNKYSRGGTAELKPYWITGNNGLTKTIRGPRKIPQKTLIFFISPIFYHLYLAENGDGHR